MKILFISLVLSGCQNLAHITNVNVDEIANITRDIELSEKINSKVAIKKIEEVKSCKHIKKSVAKDNALEAGKEAAIMYAKYEAYKMSENTIVIEEIKKVGDYGSRVHFDIYNCPSAKN